MSLALKATGRGSGRDPGSVRCDGSRGGGERGGRDGVRGSQRSLLQADKVAAIRGRHSQVAVGKDHEASSSGRTDSEAEEQEEDGRRSTKGWWPGLGT